MNMNIDLSQLKEKINGNVLITIILVVLAIALGYAGWVTFQEGVDLEASVAKHITSYNESRALLKDLKDLQANSEYYIAQKEKYDAVIAEADSYNEVDYYVELVETCETFELDVLEIEVGKAIANKTVQEATSTVTVVGDEINIKNMVKHITSQEQIARVDAISMAEQEDGTVVAILTVVNFTK